MRAHAVAAALVLFGAASLNAREPLTLNVSPAVSFAPGNLTIRVHVTPAPTDRDLEVVAESGDYYRSSRMPIDASSDVPHTIAFQIRNLPAGTYAVRGTLVNGEGRPRVMVQTRVQVVGPAGTE